jgi:CreA protein
MRRHAALAAGLLAILQASAAFADDIACVSTTFRFIGANDKVCVSAFDDPKVPLWHQIILA